MTLLILCKSRDWQAAFAAAFERIHGYPPYQDISKDQPCYRPTISKEVLK